MRNMWRRKGVRKRKEPVDIVVFYRYNFPKGRCLMTVFTYNKYLRQLLGQCECILARDTAADYLGLTNGGQRNTVQIYVKKKQDVEGTE